MKVDRKRYIDSLPEPLSIDEVNRLYPMEWVLLKVTDVDEEGVISAGQVIDHTVHRGKLNKAVKRAHEQDPDAHICIFLGGTRRASGEDLRRALAEFAERVF